MLVKGLGHVSCEICQRNLEGRSDKAETKDEDLHDIF